MRLCYSKPHFTLTYSGLFRISKLVYTGSMHTDRALQWGDVSYNFCNKVLVIPIQKSKTVKLNIYPAEKGNICCIQSVCLFMQARPKHDGYFLCHLKRDTLTRYQFNSILNKCIS